MESQNMQTQLAIPIAIVVGAGLIAIALYVSIGKTTNPSVATVKNPPVAQVPIAPEVDITKVKTDGEPFVGSKDAPVTVAYWSDYQCPFCKRFSDDAIQQLMTDYVQTGKVKIIFKDFQFLGADSQTAGLIARAVWEIAPDKFAQWHQAMYDKQDGENSGWGNKTDILALTKSLDIDSVKVDQLISDKAVEYQKALDFDKAEGGIFGIKGTPGTIIGKTFVNGAQSYAVVKQLVDTELTKK